MARGRDESAGRTIGRAPPSSPEATSWPKGPEREETSPGILLVEDDPESLELLDALLSTRYAVRRAGSAQKALALAREAPPDLVLAELRLTGSDGLRLLDELHRDPRTQDVAVILLARTDEQPLLIQALEQGASDFITKPPQARELLARVDRTLRDRRRRQALEAMATTDHLTGLYNFRALGGRLNEELERAARYEYPLALVMIDLDRLKELNDRFGHPAGNQALAELGQRLRGELRQADFAARFGGDEFLLLLPHQQADEAAILTERIRSSLRAVRLHAPGGEELPFRLTVSAGVAAHRPELPFAGAEELLRAADLALYEAKRQGRDRVVLHRAASGALEPRPTPQTESERGWRNKR